MKIILLGPPGAGKGTQAALVAKDLKIPHISTGDIFRAALKEKTPLGLKVQGYLDAGQLVPDELTSDLVKERTLQSDCSSGFLLDGFPRTLAQCNALSQMLAERGQKISHVLELEVPDDELVRRIVERGKSSGRSDDTAEVAAERLRVYYAQTKPVADFYSKSPGVKRIDGVGSIDQIEQRLLSEIAKVS